MNAKLARELMIVSKGTSSVSANALLLLDSTDGSLLPTTYGVFLQQLLVTATTWCVDLLQQRVQTSDCVLCVSLSKTNVCSRSDLLDTTTC